jgi:hypothetical protein
MKVPKSLIAGAMAIGVAVGSSGVASAATTATGTTAAPAVVAVAPAPPRPGTAVGGQRSDETLLSGDAFAKATAAAKAKVAVGTVVRVVRVETADGHATYEVHLTDSHGNPATVDLDGSFQVSTGAPS